MFEYVTQFERTIADFFGSPYAVAVDCCTHGIELALRLHNVQQTSCPRHTYLSIPMTLTKLGINWKWSDEKWQEYYFLQGTNIADAAVLWRESSYLPGTIMVLSFQFKKHLSLGRGGMILLDNKSQYRSLVKSSYDGRDRDRPWSSQDIEQVGYHYYMTPETASLGIEKFNQAVQKPRRVWSYLDYPDISTMRVFNCAKP